MSMSIQSRREYTNSMKKRYQKTKSKDEKTKIINIVTGYSRRRAVLGKGQKGVFTEIENILNSWPFAVWGFHSDSGGEFINSHLYRFCQKNGLQFTRSSPYRKNDNAHVEQKNRQFVREIVGYERYDCPEEVVWLNEVYALLDPHSQGKILI